MVQVITNRGKFNITESLLEAIKLNNPTILEAKKTDYAYEQILLPKLRKYGFTDVKQLTPILNQIADTKPEIISDVNKTADLIGKAVEKARENKKNNTKEEPKKEPEEKSELVKDKSGQQIIDNQKEENKNISGDLESSVTPEVKKEVDDNQKENNKTENLTNKNLTNKNIKNNNDKNHIPLENFIKSQKLHQNIKETEDIAANIVKRVKGLIQSYAGLGGSHTAATKSEFNDEPDNQNIQQNVKNVSNRYRAPLDLKNKKGEPQDINNYTTYSGVGRKTKSELQLALGGFKLSPYFGHKGYNGRALKYYKLATRKTNESEIDEMIDTMIAIKGGVYKLTNEDKLYYQQFENMVYNFLHNTVYRLEVNNDNHYNNIITIIRNDPSLRDMFEVEFNNVVQQFDTKENIISYRNKNDKIVDLLIISTPMFYQGKKIFKDLSKIASYGKQLKA